MNELVIFMTVLAAVMFAFAATCPEEKFIKPWMRVLSVVLGMTAVLWVPWVAKLAKENYRAALGEQVIEVEK